MHSLMKILQAGVQLPTFCVHFPCMLIAHKKKAMGRAGDQQPWVFVLLVVKLLLLSGPQMKSYISGINS